MNYVLIKDCVKKAVNGDKFEKDKLAVILDRLDPSSNNYKPALAVVSRTLILDVKRYWAQDFLSELRLPPKHIEQAPDSLNKRRDGTHKFEHRPRKERSDLMRETECRPESSGGRFAANLNLLKGALENREVAFENMLPLTEENVGKQEPATAVCRAGKENEVPKYDGVSDYDLAHKFLQDVCTMDSIWTERILIMTSDYNREGYEPAKRIILSMFNDYDKFVRYGPETYAKVLDLVVSEFVVKFDRHRQEEIWYGITNSDAKKRIRSEFIAYDEMPPWFITKDTRF